MVADAAKNVTLLRLLKGVGIEEDEEDITEDEGDWFEDEEWDDQPKQPAVPACDASQERGSGL